MELISLHEIYPGVIASLVLMLVVSAGTRKSSARTLERFFPDSTGRQSDVNTHVLTS
jgi:hypothetical protein